MIACSEDILSAATHHTFLHAQTLTLQLAYPCRQLALLVGGDAAALLLFAGIGRRNHSEGLQLAGLFGTALPFLIGNKTRYTTCLVHACSENKLHVYRAAMHHS